ncbi:hypothetical protein J4526_05305 [Desulfurococcaceae archaeon MEX13E-LK6-19]|nr:hypothetical protein J4526_05305 [Desulfurococcaceae archaeon MEX13E-LK6-19]
MNVMRLTVILIMITVMVAVFNTLHVVSITQRQDPDMPVENLVRIDNTTLINYLESLRKLNDTTVNNYVDEIEAALQRGDYETANKLLNELQAYLDEKYGGATISDEELAKALAAISATEGIGSTGAYINVSKLLEVYGDSIGDQDLLELAEKLSNLQELSPEEQMELDQALNEVLGSNFETTNIGDLFQLLNETGGAASLVEPPQLPSSKGGLLPSGGGVAAPSITAPNTTVVFLIIIGIVTAMLMIFHKQLSELFATRVKPLLGAKMADVLAKTSAKLTSLLARGEKDPVVKIYKVYYMAARAKGFKKYRHETPREFLSKITDETMRKIGEPVTKIYEERVYGGRYPRRDEIERVAEILRKHLGVSIES